jgi:hypothetical protein
MVTMTTPFVVFVVFKHNFSYVHKIVSKFIELSLYPSFRLITNVQKHGYNLRNLVYSAYILSSQAIGGNAKHVSLTLSI